MSTIVGIEFEGGTVLAGDRIHVEGGTTVSENVERVFAFDGAGAAAAGGPGAVGEFERRLDAEVRQYRLEHDEMGVDRLARTAAPIAEEVGVDAVVSARDDEGVARIRSVGRDGSVLADEAVAFGSGAEMALGRLEGAEPGDDAETVERWARELFAAIAERDAGTGADVDTWSLENEGEGRPADADRE